WQGRGARLRPAARCSSGERSRGPAYLRRGERRALTTPAASAPGRAFVRDLFLRPLGAVFLVAFLSLLAQATLLFGRQGLLPAHDYLPAWRGFTAMPTYYEPAPLPAWIGWWAHQMPLWAHRACGVFVYGVELGLPLLIWGPRRLRAAAFAGMVAMQVAVLATANYGFFNYLSLALALWVLDDGHFGRAAAPREPARRPLVLPIAVPVLV